MNKIIMCALVSCFTFSGCFPMKPMEQDDMPRRGVKRPREEAISAKSRPKKLRKIEESKAAAVEEEPQFTISKLIQPLREKSVSQQPTRSFFSRAWGTVSSILSSGEGSLRLPGEKQEFKKLESVAGANITFADLSTELVEYIISFCTTFTSPESFNTSSLATKTKNILKMRLVNKLFNDIINSKTNFSRLVGVNEHSLALAQENIDLAVLEKKYANDPLAVVKNMLVSGGLSLSVRDKNKINLLYWLAAHGHDDVFKILVKHGLDPKNDRFQEVTPIHWAVMIGKKDLVEDLVDKGFNINATDINGRTPLHYSMLNKCFISSYLINFGADLNAQDNMGATPLLYACQIYQKACDEKKTSSEVQIILNCIKALLAAGAKPNLLALRSEFNPQTGRLIPNPNYHFGLTVLDYVQQVLNVPVLENLLKDNEAINNTDQLTPLHIAVRDKNQEVLKQFIAAGHPLNVRDNKGFTALHYAAFMDNRKMVEILKGAGADINIRDAQDRNTTALHKAILLMVSNDHLENLLKYGADPEAVDSGGKTPLVYAVEVGPIEPIALLLNYHVNPDGRLPGGRTALHTAAELNNPLAVEFLAKYNADINAQDAQGDTPLHLAHRKSARHAIDLLIKLGADTSLVNHSGMRASGK